MLSAAQAINAGGSLKVLSGKTLTVPSSSTLTQNGTLQVLGTMNWSAGLPIVNSTTAQTSVSGTLNINP